MDDRRKWEIWGGRDDDCEGDEETANAREGATGCVAPSLLLHSLIFAGWPAAGRLVLHHLDFLEPRPLALVVQLLPLFQGVRFLLALELVGVVLPDLEFFLGQRAVEELVAFGLDLGAIASSF